MVATIAGRWLRLFGRLQWRLTLSYILVSVVAMLTLALATAVLASVTLKPNPPPSNYVNKGAIQFVVYGVAPYVEGYLEEHPLDLLNLKGRLASMLEPVSKGNLSENVAPYEHPVLLMVLDSSDHLVAWVGAGNGDPPASILGTAVVQSAVQEAWTGEQVSERLAGSLPSGRVAAAGPVIAYTGQVIGIVVGVFLPLPAATTAYIAQTSQQQAVEEALAKLVPGMLVFILGASVLGILTGVLFSHNLTRRLKRITSAAHDWSQGNLEVAVVDRSHDEIGELAQDLNHMAGQLQQLVLARQELAVMEERHRLAQDLHDSIKQQLFVVTMLIGTARAKIREQPDVKLTLDNMEEIATGAHQELTALIRALRPVALSGGKPLGTAVADLASSWSHSTGIGVDLCVASDLSATPEVKQALFRVAQEALANIARHSGATTATVKLCSTQESLQLDVTDDGHGFDAARLENWGLGQAGMRERMEAIGGTLSISSGPQGSRIEARCPVSAAGSGSASPEGGAAASLSGQIPDL